MRRWLAATVVALALTLPLTAAEPNGLGKPVPVMVGGKPLDIEGVGHAAPFVGDFDGDGVLDLLVGEFQGGKLRIYKNEGTNQKPKFTKFETFMDGKPEGTVLTG